MGAPNPIDMMERLDCSAVYIDDRVSSERWVVRNQLDASRAAEEPDSLQSDVQLLLSVCKQGMFQPSVSERCMC
jgi:3',5'-cyclic-nucleotide phosphodiesterase